MSKSVFGGILSPSQTSNDQYYVHNKLFSKKNYNQPEFNYFDQDIIIHLNTSNGDLFTMTGSQDPGNFMNNALFNTNNIIQRAIFLYFNQRHPAESLSMLCMISLLLIIILVIYYRKIERKNRRQTIDSLDHSIHKEQYQDTLTTFKHVESKQPESSYV